MSRLVLSFLFLSCVLPAVGCGGSAEGTAPTAKVSGVVTHKGTPVPNASVVFTPTGGRPANGVTDASGKFVLSTFGNADGAVIGMHKVTITSAAPSPPMPGTPEAAAAPPPAPAFPAKYGDPAQSGFTADVKAGSDNTFTFDMTE